MWKKILSITLIFSFILGASVFAYETIVKEVQVDLDGDVNNYITTTKNLKEFLEQENININKKDNIDHSLDAKIIDGMKIKIIKNKSIIISDDGKEIRIESNKRTLEETMKENKVVLEELDLIDKELNYIIKENDFINIKRNFKINVIDNKNENIYNTYTRNIEEFLKENSIILNGDDYIKEINNEIYDNQKIEIIRVTKKIKAEKKDIAFKTKRVSDQSLEKGKTIVKQKGKNGILEIKTEETYENGIKIKEVQLSKTITKNPTEEIILVGEKVIHQKVNRGSDHSNTQESVKEFKVKATAYTPYCKGCSGISATGINLRSDPSLKVISVDPKIIPLGTKVWVEGYGIAIAGDTGGAIKGNKIDILVQTKEEAYKWGVRTVTIKILK